MPKTTKKTASSTQNPTNKCLTGIKGFDLITEGGIPKNRTTLISGSAGTGKTLFGIDFIIKGAEHKEPGVFLSFEETEEELYNDVAALNMDLRGLVSQKKLRLEHVILDRKDIQESDFNLEGVLIRLEHAIESIGAKRVVLDSIESLFAGITDTGVLRIELKRLFRWLKEKQVTAIITGEPGPGGAFTRHGLEEYITDCIIFLDNRVTEQMSVRRIRVIKYRGSNHGTNEYPFVIDKNGLSVIPITSAGLDQEGTTKRVSTGIPSLDKMFKSGGFTKGSTILVSGTAGTGKTSLAVAFVVEKCKRGERCLFLSYEESSGQLIQNMSSIGFDLEPLVKKGLLKMVSTRPSFVGLEMHLLELYKVIEEFKPTSVVIDPLTSLINQGSEREIQSMVTRMIDLLKSKGITGFFTSLVSSNIHDFTSGEVGVSSLIDTWIVVRELEEDTTKKRIRGLYIVKSRGMSHSSDVHKLILSDDGIALESVDGTINPKGLIGKGILAKQPKRQK
ncbi:MAG: circadian clock protein KaiC [Verrucomicrobiota bacterium]|nr:circadian clock protein KaiC [Verrucomicrobiota bacterium]